jgi:hypothetical protein
VNKLDGDFVVAENRFPRGPQREGRGHSEHRRRRLDLYHARPRPLGARARAR